MIEEEIRKVCEAHSEAVKRWMEERQMESYIPEVPAVPAKMVVKANCNFNSHYFVKDKLSKMIAKKMTDDMRKPIKEEDCYFYYIRFSGKPIGTVCLATPCFGVWVRGIAWCSPEDEFRKTIGRGKAYSRMLKAIRTQEGSECLILRIMRMKLWDYNCDLTEKEKSIVGIDRNDDA